MNWIRQDEDTDDRGSRQARAAKQIMQLYNNILYSIVHLQNEYNNDERRPEANHPQTQTLTRMHAHTQTTLARSELLHSELFNDM